MPLNVESQKTKVQAYVSSKWKVSGFHHSDVDTFRGCGCLGCLSLGLDVVLSLAPFSFASFLCFCSFLHHWFRSAAVFIYALARTRYAPKMIQHAGLRRLLLRLFVCLPRGLESCRYGGAVGVTFSELGPDSSGDLSSMPSEAMSSAENRGEMAGKGGGEAPGCTEEQPAAVWRGRAALVRLPCWRHTGGGGGPRGPASHWHIPGRGRCSNAVGWRKQKFGLFKSAFSVYYAH